MNVNTTLNYLTNSAQAAQRFAGEVFTKLEGAVQRKPWGRYATAYGPVREAVKNVATGSSAGYGPADVAASAVLDAMTNETRKDVWRFTNMHRMVGDVGQFVGPRLGLESTLAGAAVAAGVPIAVGALSGQFGSPLKGMRPAGYKAVAPVSKEEDPTGRTPQSPVVEAGMRYLLGQKSQMLPYKEFKEERPDVMPSTYVQYQQFQRMKPEAGSLIAVDPQTQSFSALGGAIKGTARGLNDPELRLKGVPITASAVVGTAAGLGAIKGLSKALAQDPIGEIPEQVKHSLTNAVLGKEYSPIPLPVKKQIAITREITPESLGSRVGRTLGRYYDPALLAAGAITAAAVGSAVKKVFQKAAEKRIQKEDPIEYLKYKHGSFKAAAEAAGKPEATSWQQLVP